MKKFLIVVLAFLFTFFQSGAVSAYDLLKADKASAASLLTLKNNTENSYILKEEIPKDIKIIKKNKKYGVINKTNNEVLIPCVYEKIEKLGIDTIKVKENGKWGILSNNGKYVLKNIYDNVYILQPRKEKPKDIIHSIYAGKIGRNYYVATPGRTSKDLFIKTFRANNELSWVKYYDYPTQGIIVLKDRHKYGFIISKGFDTWLISPDYEDYYFQDSGTTIFQQFGISYSNPDYVIVKKNGKWGILNMDGSISVDFQYESIIMLDSTIKEDVTIGNDNIYLTYNSINFPQEDKLIAKKDGVTYIIDKKGIIYAKQSTAPNKIKFSSYKPKPYITDIYNKNNEIAFVKFINYPSTGIYVTQRNDKKGLAIYGENRNKLIPYEYEDFKFQDSNTGMYKQLGISYSSPDRIVAKKNGKWGIIDSDNNVIDDFQYEKVIMLSAIPKADTKYDEKGITIKYEGVEFPAQDILLVKKDKKYGVIDRNANILIPFKYEFVKTSGQTQADLQDGDKLAVNDDDNLAAKIATVGVKKKHKFRNAIRDGILYVAGFGAFLLLSPFILVATPFLFLFLAHALSAAC